MKKIAFLIAILISTTSMAQVVRASYQEVKSATDKIESMEVAYLTQVLELSVDEAQKFWPIFNDIRDERNEWKIKKKKLMYDMAQNFNTMSDDKAQEFVDGMFDIETALNESNFESRNRKIIKIIGPIRFLQLKKAEVDFRHKLFKEYRSRGKKTP